jgi:hypothetical protein
MPSNRSFLAFLLFAAGCGGSVSNPANGIHDSGDDATDGGLADGEGGDATSPCGDAAAAARATLRTLVAANCQCDAASDCTNLLWPACFGCGAYSVNSSSASAVTTAIDEACVNFDTEGCTPPDASCPTSYGITCSAGQCLVVPPMFGP